jgi:hypothetical protein
MNGLSEGKRSEDKQGRFLNLLKKWPVVLNKSQILAVKGKKEGSSGTLQMLCTNFWRQSNWKIFNQSNCSIFQIWTNQFIVKKHRAE